MNRLDYCIFLRRCGGKIRCSSRALSLSCSSCRPRVNRRTAAGESQDSLSFAQSEFKKQRVELDVTFTSSYAAANPGHMTIAAATLHTLDIKKHDSTLLSSPFSTTRLRSSCSPTSLAVFSALRPIASLRSACERRSPVQRFPKAT